MKDIWKEANLPMTKYTWFYDVDYREEKEKVLKEISKLKYPLIVKPATTGSSVGICVCDNEDSLKEGIDEAIVFCSIVISEFLFFIVYVKRFITLAFLMVIAPLITVTYSIDKLGDGKSQALNTWLKEFIFTVIIQPVHCILYLILVVPAIQGSSGMRWTWFRTFLYNNA